MHVPARLQHILAVSFAAVLLAWPALLNRYPLLYADSIGYLQDGSPTAAAIFLHHLTGFIGQRSELYALGILPFHWNLTPWPIVALNALLTAWVLFLTTRSFVPRRTLRVYLPLTVFLSLFTSASWYVSLLMPDILGPALYLSLYLLVFARDTLTRAERLALSALAVWAITAHATHLILAAGIWLLLAVLFAIPHISHLKRGAIATELPRLTLNSLAHVALLIALAAAAQLALHGYLYGRPTLNGNHPPYLMARIVADGPGRLYLQQNCPTLHWAICTHVADLPDNDDAFLWDEDGIWSSADDPTQKRLLAEEMPLVLATLRAYPGQQLAASTTNFTRQLNDFGVNDFDNNTWMQLQLAHALPNAAAPYARSLQAQDAVPSNLFTRIQRWVVLPSAILLAALLPWLYLRRRDRLLGLATIVVPMLVANAFVTAVLSSSDSRYQARVIWLIPLLAIFAVLETLPTQPHPLP